MVTNYKEIYRKKWQKIWAHSSAWIEWLPAEQLVEGSNPSGPASNLTIIMGSIILTMNRIFFFYNIDKTCRYKNSVLFTFRGFLGCSKLRGNH